jgi:hypothetical protein
MVKLVRRCFPCGESWWNDHWGALGVSSRAECRASVVSLSTGGSVAIADAAPRPREEALPSCGVLRQATPSRAARACRRGWQPVRRTPVRRSAARRSASPPWVRCSTPQISPTVAGYRRVRARGEAPPTASREAGHIMRESSVGEDERPLSWVSTGLVLESRSSAKRGFRRMRPCSTAGLLATAASDFVWLVSDYVD